MSGPTWVDVGPHEPELPITDELPAVLGGRRRRPSVWAKAAVVVLAVVAAVVIALVWSAATPETARTPTTGEVQPTVAPVDQSTAPAATVPPAPTPTPAVEQLADEAPTTWQVSGVPDRLNVREGPGTSNAVISSLADGDVVEGTGQRTAVNGSEWKQVTLENGVTAWVSASFLIPG